MRKGRLVLGWLALAILAALIWRRASSNEVESVQRSERPTPPANLSSTPPTEALQSQAGDEVRAEVAQQRSDSKPEEEDDEDALLRGRVVDSKSSPIEGAEVQIVRVEGRSFEYLGDHEFEPIRTP